ncbi:MAG TPA: hypothetical protein EYQ42_09115 [Thiotrichaceae bacterium]|jgi:hypothetical protein|nr:hypothetical protein [Thiotrichaceae bacterium]HIM08871.1 hypothetical protein [Gammaproteobacteria bacterium]
MNRYHNVFLITLLFLCSTLFSCESTRTPLQVSEHFWLGIQTKNSALVKKYSLVNSIDKSVDIEHFEKITTIAFGRIIIDGDLAEVETTVTISSNNKLHDYTVNSYLENNNDVWKVDYRKTILQLVAKKSVTEIFDGLEAMSEEVAKGVEESVKEIQKKIVPEIKSKAEEIQEKVVPKIKSNIEQAEKEIIKKLPEWKNIFDEFLHELEKSLEELMPSEKELKKESEEQPKTHET